MFVDDEQLIIKSLERTLIKASFETQFVSNGKEALLYLEDNDVDLIISDIRMPELDGCDLLKIVKERHPSVLRVALSGFSDKDLVFKMIDDNIAKTYLFKPWDNSELEKDITRILELEEELKSNELLEFVNNTDGLPTIPRIYQQVNRLVEEQASIADISRIIHQDIAISSKVLRLANTAYYGRKTGNLQEAIMTIGLNNLKVIILATEFIDLGNNDQHYIELLWKHSIFSNRLTGAIYSHFLNKKIPALFASAGLLHDIGVLMLYTRFPELYEKLIKKSYEMKIPLIDLEGHDFAITHQQMGAYLLNWWDLPYDFIEASLYHHRPYDERVMNKELLFALHVSNAYSLNRLFEKPLENTLNQDVLLELGIEKNAIEKLVDKLLQE